MKLRLLSLVACLLLFQNTFAAFPIRYDKHVVSQTQSWETKRISTSTYPQNEDSGLFGILALGCAVVGVVMGLFVPSTGSSSLVLIASILLTASFTLGILGCQQDRKLKGLAIAAIALGFVFAIVFFIWLASLFYTGVL